MSTDNKSKLITSMLGIRYQEWAVLHSLKPRYARAMWERGYSILRRDASYGKKHPLHSTFTNMLTRCYNPNHPQFKYWGGKGVTVCARWFYSFDQFVEDMGPIPEGYSLDRIDSDGNYCPENCRWADGQTQNLNRKPPARGVTIAGYRYIGMTKDRKNFYVQIRNSELRVNKRFKTLDQALTFRNNIY